jgi:hypothetical protein
MYSLIHTNHSKHLPAVAIAERRAARLGSARAAGAKVGDGL